MALIKDLIKIYNLISELIYQHHPITLDIRYRFCEVLSGGKCWNNREEWDDYIKGDCGDYTLTSFIRSLLTDRIFRKDILRVLSFETINTYKVHPWWEFLTDEEWKYHRVA